MCLKPSSHGQSWRLLLSDSGASLFINIATYSSRVYINVGINDKGVSVVQREWSLSQHGVVCVDSKNTSWVECGLDALWVSMQPGSANQTLICYSCDNVDTSVYLHSLKMPFYNYNSHSLSFLFYLFKLLFLFPCILIWFSSTCLFFPCVSEGSLLS